MQFEWDADKAALNLKKHGVRFETAALVFNDENRIEFYDSAHSLFEDRYNTIGKVDEILFVIHGTKICDPYHLRQNSHPCGKENVQ